jgi:hypothetical protein
VVAVSLMAGHTLANALKWSCSHGVGLDFMYFMCY